MSCCMTAPYLQNRPRLVFDTECAINYWVIGFKNPATGKCLILERTPTKELDRKRLAKIIRNYCIVGFNSASYDIPMILMAMTGADNKKLKECNDQLIPGKGEKWALFRPWQFMEHYGLRAPPFLDHIDLFEVSPAAAATQGLFNRVGLKMYGARMHSRTIMDLPFDPHEVLSPKRIQVTRDVYLPNDLELTADFLKELEKLVYIRTAMSAEHKIDLRSMSDAQIAEAVIKKEVESRLGRRIYRPDIKPMVIRYVPPDFIKFKTAYLQEKLQRIVDTPFQVRADGYINNPPFLTKVEQVTVGGMAFQMGIGGLHSTESSVSYYEDDDIEIVDRDVRGYYPNQIIKSGKGPKAMGPHFQPVYQGIVRNREVAKAKGDKDRAEGGKVMSNGTFGKTNQPGSVLYAPEMLLQTTIGGQLSIFMLIESLTLAGFRVISANTDGIVTLVDRKRRWLFEAIIFDWECDTGLVTEEVCYRSLHSRDVNSYVAITTDGKVKTKGNYAQSGPGQPAAMGMKKAPDAQITSDAVVEFLLNGTPVEKTINACYDVRQFLVVYRVGGGCVFDGEYQGKVVRWYHSTELNEQLRDSDGKAVAGSMGGRPLMTLTDGNALPDDIDINWYIREAYARLEDAGVPVVDPALRGRSGTFLARLEDQKTVHIVDAATGTAMCGRGRKSIRETWNETTTVPEGRGMCSKCKKASDL